MGVVDRGIRTKPASPEYARGFVFAFRRCPECNKLLNVMDERRVKGEVVSFEFECPDMEGCGVKGEVSSKDD